ncbi:unnamed protein product [Paramecium octaurelia]|uniref:Uncharacterized protein n=1 Tax=Paramecium octaurelia TaxID=43137 RepID=A0A8S1TK57_PAROT|nr:unnamed protein product [Paramecium octaurelia]
MLSINTKTNSKRQQNSLYRNPSKSMSQSSFDLQDILLDRRIQIAENLSKLRDYQEEREKEFRQREKEYQRAKKKVHLYQVINQRFRAQSFIEEQHQQAKLLERSIKYVPMTNKSVNESKLLTLKMNLEPLRTKAKQIKPYIDHDVMVTQKWKEF